MCNNRLENGTKCSRMSLNNLSHCWQHIPLVGIPILKLKNGHRYNAATGFMIYWKGRNILLLTMHSVGNGINDRLTACRMLKNINFKPYGSKREYKSIGCLIGRGHEMDLEKEDSPRGDYLGIEMEYCNNYFNLGNKDAKIGEKVIIYGFSRDNRKRKFKPYYGEVINVRKSPYKALEIKIFEKVNLMSFSGSPIVQVGNENVIGILNGGDIIDDWTKVTALPISSLLIWLQTI